MWIKLSKSFFNFEYDTYLCCCYIPPVNSKLLVNKNIDLHDVLLQEILKFQDIGEIIILGDLNSRLGGRQEHWVDIKSTSADGNVECEHVDIPIRLCQDTKSNSYGTKLLDILNQCHLLIVNGRVPGDLLGRYTYHGYNGSSCIDFGICSANIYNDVRYFKTFDFPWYSDHVPICLSINCCWSQAKDTEYNLLNSPPRYKWDEMGRLRFINTITSPEFVSRLHELSSDIKDSNVAVEQLTSIFQYIAGQTLMKSKSSRTKNIRGPFSKDNSHR